MVRPEQGLVFVVVLVTCMLVFFTGLALISTRSRSGDNRFSKTQMVALVVTVIVLIIGAAGIWLGVGFWEFIGSSVKLLLRLVFVLLQAG